MEVVSVPAKSCCTCGTWKWLSRTQGIPRVHLQPPEAFLPLIHRTTFAPTVTLYMTLYSCQEFPSLSLVPPLALPAQNHLHGSRTEPPIEEYVDPNGENWEDLWDNTNDQNSASKRKANSYLHLCLQHWPTSPHFFNPRRVNLMVTNHVGSTPLRCQLAFCSIIVQRFEHHLLKKI